MPTKSAKKDEDQPTLNNFILVKSKGRKSTIDPKPSTSNKGLPLKALTSKKITYNKLSSKSTPTTSKTDNPKTRTPPSTEKRPDKKLNLEPNNKTMERPTSPGKPVAPEKPNTPPNNPAKPTPEKQTPSPVEPKGPATPEDRMLAMETRLMAALQSLQDIVTPMQQDLTDLKNAYKDQMVKRTDIEAVHDEQKVLHQRVTKMSKEHATVKTKLNKIEEQLLETNLIFHGLDEEKWEKEAARQQKIHDAILNTLSSSIEDKDEHVKTFEIVKSRRIGKYVENCNRPIAATFTRKIKVEEVLNNKKKLPDGVYVDREYTEQVENNRRILRPILRAAKRLEPYKMKSKLDGDTLVLQGNRYTVDNLHTLPMELNGYTVSSQTNDDTIGFFGALNPLSNFYKSSFIYSGTKYETSEHFIQHAKAKLFKDHTTAKEILCCNSPLEAKRLSKNISNFNLDEWKAEAYELCLPGIKCKFMQNEYLWNLLQSTGDKTIVESSYDSVWGTGIPLTRPDALERDKWKSVGLLGKILMRIRLSNPSSTSNVESDTDHEQMDAEHSTDT